MNSSTWLSRKWTDRPNLVSIGSCILAVLLYGNDLYTLNLGDGRAVLATYNGKELKAVELTENHNVDNEVEKSRLLCEHPDDPKTVIMGKVQGKLKVTRALGVGYLRKEVLNDSLAISMHMIPREDHFVVVASEELFDFFSNDEVVSIINSFILENPASETAKYIVEQLLRRAADGAGLNLEELMDIPAGKRRNYHDDVIVIVIMLGMNQRTPKASTHI